MIIDTAIKQKIEKRLKGRPLRAWKKLLLLGGVKALEKQLPKIFLRSMKSSTEFRGVVLDLYDDISHNKYDNVEDLIAHLLYMKSSRLPLLKRH